MEQQKFFDAMRDSMGAAPTGLITWNNADSALRFAIYRNTGIVSLIDALADSFPVVQELVGEDFFRAMARIYAGIEPPRSPVMAFYGASFPDFIETFSPAAALPYLPDVARLEMLRVRSYHAADAVALPADAIALALVDVDSLPTMQIVLHPAVELLRSNYAVASLWAAHQGILDVASIDTDQAESVLVRRPHLDVEVVPLADSAVVFMLQLQRGVSLGNAVEHTKVTHADFDLNHSLSLLVQKQLIFSLTTPRT
jgi:Putative DNA-binding domain